SIKELIGNFDQDPLAVLKTQYVLGWLPPRESPWRRGWGIDIFIWGWAKLQLRSVVWMHL
ncbi:hypothetical protein P4G97_22350, partial [Bacillus cereus]|nr:hypothetical protein [Bacillus cereus]MEB9817411.1 hypothetical protein [Bacillus cereus]